jgi:O-antigen ligase/tetratricopeptide (TPR) repeat protein
MTTIDKTLLWVTRIGVFLIPFVPLIITASLFFPFITGKNFAFRIIVEIIFACYLLLALRRPEFRPRRSLFLWGIAAFLFIVLLADIFAANPFKAFFSNFERMEGFITLAHLGAYFLVVSSVLNTEKLWHRFFATSVGVSAFLGIYGILQLAGKIVINQGGVRLDGTFGNAAYFAGYMLFHIFLTLFLIFRHRLNPGIKWLYGGAILLQVFTLVFTATRGAALGLLGGLVLSLLLIALFERGNARIRKGAIGALAALVVFVAGFYAARDTDFIKTNPALTRFASVRASDAGPRLMVWGMAWEGFKENPILGWGQEGFNFVFNKYYNPDMWSQEQWFDRTHNIFFDWLIAAGLLGLLSYLSLFCFLLWYLWKGRVTDGGEPFSLAEKSILTGLLAAYFVHNFFVFDNLISYILFFSLLGHMHSRFKDALRESPAPAAPASEQAYYIGATVVLIAFVGSVYFLNVRPIGVALNLIEGLKPHPEGVAKNLEFYKKAFALETIGTQEVAEQTMQTAITIAAAAQVPDALKTEFISQAALAMNREIERVPDDARLRMFIGGFFNRLGRFAEALPHVEKAHELSPSKQTIAFELANTYLATGKTAEAAALLKGAFENAPEFTGARVAYAVAAVYARQFDVPKELFASTTAINVLTDDRLVKAYFDAKEYGVVSSLLKLRLEADPNNPQTHVSLAAAYLSSGNRGEAIRSLRKAIELNPEFKKQGEFYISEIQAGRNP